MSTYIAHYHQIQRQMSTIDGNNKWSKPSIVCQFDTEHAQQDDNNDENDGEQRHQTGVHHDIRMVHDTCNSRNKFT